MKRSGRSLSLTALFAAAILANGATNAKAGIVYSFNGIDIDAAHAADAAIGQAQFSVEVSDLGGNKVEFAFTNTGSAASSIASVYFDDGSQLFKLSPFSITNDNSAGKQVNFSQGASPGDLPGGNTINFHSSSDFLADADTPQKPQNGVNPGETLKITFELLTGMTYQDTIDALNYSLDPAHSNVSGPPGLRIGIHVTSFADGNSVSFVNGPPTSAVPEPSTVALALSGVSTLALAAFRRRRHV